MIMKFLTALSAVVAARRRWWLVRAGVVRAEQRPRVSVRRPVLSAVGAAVPPAARDALGMSTVRESGFC